jgi:hypothetical protein
MAWTYEQRVERARDLLEDRAVMSADQFETQRRPPFFNRYRFGIGLSVTPESWYRFDELKHMVQQGVAAMDCFVQSNGKSYEIYLFSSNPKVIRWMARNHRDFHVNWLRMIDPSCWSRTLPAAKPKGKFFNQYSWRLRLSRWQMDMRPVDSASGTIDCAFPGLTHHAIAAIGGPKRTMRQGPRLERTFVYVDRIADVLMLKLILGSDIIEIEER